MCGCIHYFFQRQADFLKVSRSDVMKKGAPPPLMFPCFVVITATIIECCSDNRLNSYFVFALLGNRIALSRTGTCSKTFLICSKSFSRGMMNNAILPSSISLFVNGTSAGSPESKKEPRLLRHGVTSLVVDQDVRA